MNPQDPTTRLAGSSPQPGPPCAIVLIYYGDDVIHTRLEPTQSIIVGRLPTAEVLIPDASISKQHARLTFDGHQKVIVEDLGATNGTIYKGRPIQKHEAIAVTHGAELYFGAVAGIVYIPASSGLEPSAEDVSPKDDFHGEIIADAPGMKQLLALADQFARASETIVITGETGTGKEEIAKLVHRKSYRRDQPFIPLNCAAISPHLLESTLFGHEKGSFTGASTQTKGFFQEAHGGTLFLDEVGELTQEAQKALLRVLETGTITRVGSSKEIPVDVRLIAASWRDLRAMCAEGKFRLDLYYRLHVLTLHLPPLRERREDIPKLVGHFLRRANKVNKRSVKGIEDDALQTLLTYDWPGNIRELRNWIARAVVLAQTDKIRLADLPAHIDKKTPRDSEEQGRQPGSNPRSKWTGGALKQNVEAFEKECIEEVLRRTDFDTAEAAKVLGLELRTLQRRLNKYGITPKDRYVLKR